MEFKGNTFQDFDLVVQIFALAVELFLFLPVLYVTAPVSDGAGGGVDFLHFKGRVLLDPFSEIFVLDRIGERHQDLMEEL